MEVVLWSFLLCDGSSAVALDTTPFLLCGGSSAFGP